MKLRELLSVNKDGLDFEFLHTEYCLDVASVCELSMGTFTKEGLKKWDTVLNSKVEDIAVRNSLLYVTVSGVGYTVLEKFTYALAGYVSSSDYDMWFK